MDYLLQTTAYLFEGAVVSLTIFLVTIVGSFPSSLFLVTLYKRRVWLQKVISVYTWLFRGTPLMLQLFFFMYFLPSVGIMVDRMMVAYITFILNYTAYFVEILRAGVESVPKDQLESASVEGASQLYVFRKVVLPQAIRKELPTITNETITLIKDTSLVTVIAISDLMRGVKEVVSRDFTISPFVLAAVFYLLISYSIVVLMRKVEKKVDFMDTV
jgi:polar amino acid transport system permease protein